MSRHLNIEVNNDGNKQKLVLKAYSPGDGALSVNCVYPDNLRGETAPFYATEKDIMKLRDTHFREYGVLKIKGDSPQYRLFTPVERVSDNELKLEGRIYRYEERNDSGLNELDFDHIGVFTTSKRFSDKKEVEVEVPNVYIKSHIDFYLKNEEKILESKNKLGNEKAFEYSISGAAREARMSGYNM